METLVFLVGTALIVWFFVWISAPKKKHNTYIQKEIKNGDIQEEAPNFTITTREIFSSPSSDVSYSEEFIKNKNLSLARKSFNPTPKSIPIPSLFIKKQEWCLILKMTESRSIGFRRMLPIIKNFPSYREYWENDLKIFEVSFKKEQLHDFKKIYDDVKNLKGTQVFINEDLIERTELSKLLRCAVDRNLANKDFCYGASIWTLNPFGCHRIKIRANGECAWYKYAFLQNNKVIVDKKKILEELTIDLKKYRYCPYLDIEKVWENFLMLPDEISLYDENFAVVLTLDGRIEVLNRWDLGYLRYTSFEEIKEMYGDRLLSKK